MLASSTQELIHSTLPYRRDSNSRHIQISHINRHSIKSHPALIQPEYLSNMGRLTTASALPLQRELLWHLHFRHLPSK